MLKKRKAVARDQELKPGCGKRKGGVKVAYRGRGRTKSKKDGEMNRKGRKLGDIQARKQRKEYTFKRSKQS